MQRRTIGRLAKETGVNLQTIRYYHRVRLIPRPDPVDGRWRVYGEEAVFAVRFIKRLQKLGFSLGEIRGLILLLCDPGEFCIQAGAAAEKKLGELEQQLRELLRIRGILAAVVRCRGEAGKFDSCQVLTQLEGELSVSPPGRKDDVQVCGGYGRGSR